MPATSAKSEPLRLRPPHPTDTDYDRLLRSHLIGEILARHLHRERVVALLDTHHGGGKTLARQIAPHCGTPVAWLTNNAPPMLPTAAFYQMLTRNDQVCCLSDLYAWLRSQASARGLLVVLFGTRGRPDLLEEIAATVCSLRADRRFAFLVVGGECLLQLRTLEHYFWSRLIPETSFFDVPDLTPDETSSLVDLRLLPPERSAMLYQASGGHPWLLHHLICSNATDATHANEAVRDLLSMSCKRARYLSDAKSCEVIRRLLRGESVAPLGERRVRYAPEHYAESRLYFDGFLSWARTGKTQLRCPGVKLLFEHDLGSLTG